MPGLSTTKGLWNGNRMNLWLCANVVNKLFFHTTHAVLVRLRPIVVQRQLSCRAKTRGTRTLSKLSALVAIKYGTVNICLALQTHCGLVASHTNASNHPKSSARPPFCPSATNWLLQHASSTCCLIRTFAPLRRFLLEVTPAGVRLLGFAGA